MKDEEIEEIMNMGAYKKKKKLNKIVHFFDTDENEVFLHGVTNYRKEDNTLEIFPPTEPFEDEYGDWVDVYSIRINSEALFYKHPAADIEILVL